MQVSSDVNNYVIWSCTGDCRQSTYSRNWKLADGIISMGTRKCLALFDFLKLARISVAFIFLFSLNNFYSKLNLRLLLSVVSSSSIHKIQIIMSLEIKLTHIFLLFFKHRRCITIFGEIFDLSIQVSGFSGILSNLDGIVRTFRDAS